jgi:hypothetical protein
VSGTNHLAWRAALAVVLMLGYYVLALAVIAALIAVPVTVARVSSGLAFKVGSSTEREPGPAALSLLDDVASLEGRLIDIAVRKRDRSTQENGGLSLNVAPDPIAAPAITTSTARQARRTVSTSRMIEKSCTSARHTMRSPKATRVLSSHRRRRPGRSRAAARGEGRPRPRQEEG